MLNTKKYPSAKSHGHRSQTRMSSTSEERLQRRKLKVQTSETSAFAVAHTSTISLLHTCTPLAATDRYTSLSPL
ncbi:uncharacterized protein EKO05_0004370 [Ascochyta rabiei]|uniref:uncharacterized protein n=1 Tax=Didymella rabiei TaxID=5454 RepID=UPI002208BCF9|nr:uncharacterized protein EKO05_0004370 [Ascochyta rabiei]UPX13874.1 hypothetical protein EKO05_0004370 [Ascochyta rabiei]